MRLTSGVSSLRGPAGLGVTRTVSLVCPSVGAKLKSPAGLSGPTWPSNPILRLGSTAVKRIVVCLPLACVNHSVVPGPVGPVSKIDASRARATHFATQHGLVGSYRDATFATVIAGMWPDPAQNEANIAWVRDFYDATAPHSEEGGYINFMADDDQDRVRVNNKENYDRLVDTKRHYDPDNLFHLNQNIRP